MSGSAGVLRSRFAAAPNIAAFLALWLNEPGLLQGEAADTFQNYYRGFRKSFPPRMRRFYASQIAEALALLRFGARVLEIGCGLGTESLWLAMQGAHVVAIDLREDRLDAAQERRVILERALGRDLFCHFVATSVLDLPEHATFDLIWMEQTFHHLEPRAAVVAKIAALLAPGGHVVISEANAWNVPLQLQLLLRRGWPRVVSLKGADGRQHAYGVERITTPGAIAAAFAEVGVEMQSVRYFRMFPNHPLFDLFSRLEEAPWLARWAPLFTHFNYVGVRPAEGALSERLADSALSARLAEGVLSARRAPPS